MSSSLFLMLGMIFLSENYTNFMSSEKFHMDKFHIFHNLDTIFLIFGSKSLKFIQIY
jgi:hypothetical protein